MATYSRGTVSAFTQVNLSLSANVTNSTVVTAGATEKVKVKVLVMKSSTDSNGRAIFEIVNPTTSAVRRATSSIRFRPLPTTATLLKGTSTDGQDEYSVYYNLDPVIVEKNTLTFELYPGEILRLSTLNLSGGNVGDIALGVERYSAS